MQSILIPVPMESVETAEGRMAHNKGWNRANGMASNYVFDAIPFLFGSSHYHKLVLPN